MLALIAIIIFGLGFASFATQNTSEVILRLGSYILPIPLYTLAFGSLLLGVLVSEIIHLTKSMASSALIRQKNEKIREDQDIINNLSEKIHQLESEKGKLQKDREDSITVEDNNGDENNVRNFFDRFHL